MTSQPESLSTPGQALQSLLETRGWTQAELAEIIGRPGRLISEIVAGKRAVTPETAHELASAFDTKPQYWLELEAAFQLGRVGGPNSQIERKAKLRARFPVREMAKRGWIRSASNIEELEAEVLRFFGINNIDEPLVFNHAARRNYANVLSAAQEAWLFRVLELSSSLVVPKYSESRLLDSLVDLELLMTEPEEIRHVPRLLQECGVRFVIVEPIPGSRIDGVCFWLDKNRSPVIGLSLKGSDQIDRFWFNLRHEIEHVLRGDGRDVAIIDDFDDNLAAENEAERIANLAAADFCVPTAKMKDFFARHHPMYSEQSLIGFSRLMKRHPGLVAGQIQKRLDRWDLFRKYQPKVRHIITQTALTDGYGQSVETRV